MSWSRRRDSLVGIATGYGLNVRGSILGKGKWFYVFHSIQTGSGAHQASYTMNTGGSFLGRKAAGPVKQCWQCQEWWSCSLYPHICLRGTVLCFFGCNNFLREYSYCRGTMFLAQTRKEMSVFTGWCQTLWSVMLLCQTEIVRDEYVVYHLGVLRDGHELEPMYKETYGIM
jgi:hypothetical protein